MEAFVFVEGDVKSFEATLKVEMEKPFKHYEKELAALRTNRVSTSIVENIKVECYGEMMPMREVGVITAAEATLLTIQPWDKAIIPEIEKALKNSDVGVTPANDGSIIRLQFPNMSAQRRDELVKTLNKKTEDARVGIRNVRKEFHNQIREAEKKRSVSEDFAKRLSLALQKGTDAFIEKIDQIGNKKEAELIHV